MADWVLVVDDDTSNLKMAGHILSRNNMRVSAMKSGQALLDYLKDNEAPDLILLDINMPEMDGFETLKKLRELERGNGKDEIPVIFLTANEDEESETKGLSLGAMDFIKKPFVPDVLTLRVRHMIELIRLQRNLSEEVRKKRKITRSFSCMSSVLWQMQSMQRIPTQTAIPGVWPVIREKLQNAMDILRRRKVISI